MLCIGKYVIYVMVMLSIHKFYEHVLFLIIVQNTINEWLIKFETMKSRTCVIVRVESCFWRRTNTSRLISWNVLKTGYLRLTLYLVFKQKGIPNIIEDNLVGCKTFTGWILQRLKEWFCIIHKVAPEENKELGMLPIK